LKATTKRWAYFCRWMKAMNCREDKVRHIHHRWQWQAVKTLICKKTFDKIDCWGFPSFINKQELMDNRDTLLANKALTVCFDITVHKKTICGQNCGSRGRLFAQFFGVKEMSDCRLVVGKDRREFFARRLFSVHNQR